NEGVAGIALGSVIGAAMVAIALALGVTAPLVPLRFGHASASVLSVPILAVLLFGGLSLDGDRQPGDGAGGALAKSNASVSPSVLPAERRHHRAGQAVPGRTAGARVSFSRVLATTTVVSDIAVRRTIPRWAGLVLVLLYLGLVAGSDLVHRGPGALPRSRVRRPKGCRLSMCTRITDRRAAHGWRSQTDTPGRPAAGRRHRAGAGGGRLPSGPSTR